MVIIGEKGADVGVVGAASSVGTYGRLRPPAALDEELSDHLGYDKHDPAGRGLDHRLGQCLEHPIGGVGERNPAGPGRLAPPPVRSPAPPVSAS